MGRLLMGVKEAVRLAAVREAHEGRMTVREGMRRTGLSRRQFLRYQGRDEASARLADVTA